MKIVRTFVLPLLAAAFMAGNFTACTQESPLQSEYQTNTGIRFLKIGEGSLTLAKQWMLIRIHHFSCYALAWSR